VLRYVKALLDRAIRSFNVNPKRGLKFVTGPSGMVEPGDASGLADFLLTTRGLNKEKVSAQKLRCVWGKHFFQQEL